MIVALGIIFLVAKKSQKAKEPFIYRRASDDKASSNAKTKPDSSMTSFRDSVKAGFTKFACFSGRTSRPEFWWWMLFSVSVSILTSFIALLSIIGSLVLLVPNMTMAVRRLHDTNHSGWWYAWVLIPSVAFLACVWSGYFTSGSGLGLLYIPILIGDIVIIVWWCKPGDEGDNKYGSNPLASTSTVPTRQLFINDEAVEDQETNSAGEAEEAPRYIKID